MVIEQTSYESTSQTGGVSPKYIDYLWAKCVVSVSQSSEFYHLPEERCHLAAILQNSPDEERRPGEEAAFSPIHAVATQQLTDALGGRRKIHLDSL